MNYKHYLITFRNGHDIVTRIVEATSRDNAMGCVCSFVLSCELCD